MSYPIFRSNKIKSVQGVRDVLDELARKRLADCKRADPEKVGLDTFSCSADTAFDAFLEKLPAKIRKNAVYGLTFVVGASSDFTSFDQFFEASKNWLNDTFGGSENCIAWAIHRDEATPHMQLMYIPLKDGALNAKHYIGGDKHRMEALQADFYEKVGKPFGLEKPVSKAESKKQHMTAEQWERYRQRQEARLVKRSQDLDSREDAVRSRETKVSEREQVVAHDEKKLVEMVTLAETCRTQVNEMFPNIPDSAECKKQKMALTEKAWDWVVSQYREAKKMLTAVLLGRELKKKKIEIDTRDRSDSHSR